MISAIDIVREKRWKRLLDRLAAPRQAALLWILTIAVEKQLPLVPVLSAFAEDSRGGWRRKIWELARSLNAGMSVPDALDWIPGIVPRSAVLAARVGEESGTLGPALRLAAETFTSRQQTARTRMRNDFVYIFMLLGVTSAVISFVMYWIIPKFKKIFDDFGTELPRLTILLVDASHILVPACLLGMFGLFIAFLLLLTFRTLHPAEALVMGLLGRFVPGYRTPDALRSLSVVMQAGRPIVSGISSLETHLTDVPFRRRICQVHIGVQAGGEPWTEMVRARLLRQADAAVLSSAEDVGNLAWALRATADSIERQFDYRLQLFLEFFRPAALLACGAVIGVFVVGLFLPLIKLLGDLS